MKEELFISVDSISLPGILTIPQNAQGIVVFAHGSGSSRHSPRNQFVAEVFNQHSIATLLLDLLTQDEETQDKAKGEYRFNISLLASRLARVIDWIIENEKTQALPIGLFGASTGAAAALIAASQRRTQIAAVVSRGGRPDLAIKNLSHVLAPTLFVVGEGDLEVIELNKLAFNAMHCVRKFEIIPKATHLFEERGALEAVAELSLNWFLVYFSSYTNYQK